MRSHERRLLTSRRSAVRPRTAPKMRRYRTARDLRESRKRRRQAALSARIQRVAGASLHRSAWPWLPVTAAKRLRPTGRANPSDPGIETGVLTHEGSPSGRVRPGRGGPPGRSRRSPASRVSPRSRAARPTPSRRASRPRGRGTLALAIAAPSCRSSRGSTPRAFRRSQAPKPKSVNAHASCLRAAPARPPARTIRVSTTRFGSLPCRSAR
jgi:hypothetical protein